MGLAFVPFYVKYLGVESYGLIGVFASLQAAMGILDLGMTPTLTREMARYTAGAHTSESIYDLLRSLEVICFVIAFVIGIAIWFPAAWISTEWLNAGRLPVNEVTQAISLMGFVVALRFIEGLYRGAILGLQKQVWLNVVGSILATVRGAGAVCVLVWVEPSIEAFFIWQGLASLITTVVFITAVYIYLPPIVQTPRISWSQIKSIWQFAGGMLATSLLTLLLTQTDKIILSHLLSLEIFGYYTLAGTVSTVLYQLTSPITQTYYPRFIELVTKRDDEGLAIIYHQSAQIISVLIVPAALLLIFFGENIILLLTGDVLIARNVAPLLSLLALGTMLNGFMHIPYFLTLANGWTSLSVYQNLVAVTFLVPAILWAAPRYGAVGTALVWVILNASYVVVGVHYIFRRLLKTEKYKWYLYDVAFPTCSALSTVTIFWIVHPEGFSKLAECFWLLASGFCAVAAAVSVTSNIRTILYRFVREVFGKYKDIR